MKNSHPKSYRTLLAYAVSTLALLGFTGCGTNDEPAAGEPDTCLSDAMMELVKIEEAGLEYIEQELSLTGQITTDPDRIYHVYPAAGGVVERVHVRLGDRVRRGQPLATLRSPDITAFRSEKQSARAELVLAERSLELTKSLVESGVLTQRDLIQAEADVERARINLERLEDQAEVLGVSEGTNRYVLKAPQTGFVTARDISNGMILQNDSDEALFSIADLREVWVVANVYESDIRMVRAGTAATIRTLAYPDTTMSGKVLRVTNILHPNKRVAEAIIALPNPDFLLKPGMFANVSLSMNGDQKATAIISEAVIFDNDRHHVVIYRDRCDVEVRQVEITERLGGIAYLKSGVEPGESVVSNKQLLIYNQITY